MSGAPSKGSNDIYLAYFNWGPHSPGHKKWGPLTSRCFPIQFSLGVGSENPNEIPVLLVHPRSAADTHVIISVLIEGQELSEVPKVQGYRLISPWKENKPGIWRTSSAPLAKTLTLSLTVFKTFFSQPKEGNPNMTWGYLHGQVNQTTFPLIYLYVGMDWILKHRMLDFSLCPYL